MEDELFKNPCYFQEKLKEELYITRQKLLSEEKQRKAIENELVQIKRTVPMSENDFEVNFVIHFPFITIVLVFYVLF